MTDIKDKQEDYKNVPVPERGAPAIDQGGASGIEASVNPESKIEKKDIFREDEKVSEGLKREVELMQMDVNLKQQAEEKASMIHSLADDDKLKELLRVAKDKGVVYAIQVCKRMNDPYLLDTLHDVLAKEGYYQNFIKK